jgi:energy-converting hydrogenase Eha subunit F
LNYFLAILKDLVNRLVEVDLEVTVTTVKHNTPEFSPSIVDAFLGILEETLFDDTVTESAALFVTISTTIPFGGIVEVTLTTIG